MLIRTTTPELVFWLSTRGPERKRRLRPTALTGSSGPRLTRSRGVTRACAGLADAIRASTPQSASPGKSANQPCPTPNPSYRCLGSLFI